MCWGKKDTPNGRFEDFDGDAKKHFESASYFHLLGMLPRICILRTVGTLSDWTQVMHSRFWQRPRSKEAVPPMPCGHTRSWQRLQVMPPWVGVLVQFKRPGVFSFVAKIGFFCIRFLLTSIIFLDFCFFFNNVELHRKHLIIRKSGFLNWQHRCWLFDLIGVPADVIEILTKGGDAKDWYMTSDRTSLGVEISGLQPVEPLSLHQPEGVSVSFRCWVCSVGA